MTNNQAINDKIIQDIIKREGGYSNDPADSGGRTQFGIAERHHPKAWADGQVSLEEASEIYYQKYLVGPGFDKIHDPRLRAQLVDFGVNSGPGVAIQKLQTLLRTEVDGVLGPKTLAAIAAYDPIILNNKLALERVRMIGRIVSKNPSQAKFLNGWLGRAIEFIVG